MNWVVRLLMRLARPLPGGHIYNATTGELYMERFELFHLSWCWARLHHIVRPDLDRHLHDHPWNFVSMVLQGGYVERRPIFEDDWFSAFGDVERTYGRVRTAGNIAYRRALDRHQITMVDENTWTLFITGRYRNAWGFYTPGGKVPYRKYLGMPAKEAA